MDIWEFEAREIAPPLGAVGRLPNGMVVFVPYVLPGEKARIRLVQTRRHWGYGEVVELLEAHPHRVRPLCPHFTQCGGCDWQMLPYEDQWALKQAHWESKWQRHAFPKPPRWQAIASPQAWGYRRRLKCRVRRGQVFLSRKQRPDLVPIQECHLIEKPLNEGLKALNQKQWHLNDGAYDWYSPAITQEFPGDEYWWHQKVLRVWPDQEPQVWVLEAHLGVFFQAHGVLNQHLIGSIAHFCEHHGITHVLDLYAGAGNLSLGLWKQGIALSQIIGVEVHPLAVELAKHRIQRWLTQGRTVECHWIQQSVDGFIRARLDGEKRMELVILDPPREGLSPGVRQWLLEKFPGYALVYVSCYPDTWFRDAAILSQRWRLVSVSVLDMYPQTYHLEVLSFWVRDSGS